jgi:hypothetical protein
MGKQQYYYLISGLPDLAVTDTHLPLTAKTFLEDVRSKIAPEDFVLIRTLFYQKDNKNLLSILFSRGDEISVQGYYSLQELKKGIEGNMVLPQYMENFISSFKENKERYAEAEWEAKLTEAHFKSSMNFGNEFLRWWFEFELDLKNLLLVLSNRKQNRSSAEFIIEANEMASLFKQNPSGDFSTEKSLGYFNSAVKIVETENWIEREKKIDLLNWKQLEEMTFFNYFTIEAVLAFTIKLMILERWIMLEQEKEKISLSSLLNSFTEKIKILQE